MTALASLRSVARALASPRCAKGRLSWAGVASSSVPQRAAPGCWSIYHYRRSEEVGDSTYPHRRRPSSFQEGDDLPALIGTRIRSDRRGQNGREGRTECHRSSARRNLDGPADAGGKRHRGNTEDPPGEPERSHPGGNALRG